MSVSMSKFILVLVLYLFLAADIERQNVFLSLSLYVVLAKYCMKQWAVVNATRI